MLKETYFRPLGWNDYGDNAPCITIYRNYMIGRFCFLLLLGLMLTGCSGQLGRLIFVSKNYTIRVDATMATLLERGQTVEVFSQYIERENESFPMEVVEESVLQQLIAAGYKRPVANQPAQVYLLVDRSEVRTTRESEETDVRLNICGQQILDYLDDGYSSATALPFNFVYRARHEYDAVSAVHKLVSNFGGEDKRTAQQKELDNFCTTMSRKVTRQKVVVEDRLILDAIPAAGYFSGNPQPPVWRLQAEGSGGVPALLVASGRAIKRGVAGQWDEKVVTSESDYIEVLAFKK